MYRMDPFDLINIYFFICTRRSCCPIDDTNLLISFKREKRIAVTILRAVIHALLETASEQPTAL